MGDRNKGLYEKKEGPMEPLKDPKGSLLYMGPPKPPEELPDPLIQMIREDGCGSLVLLVLAVGMLAFMLGLATGCTARFNTFESDTDAEMELDGDDAGEDGPGEPDSTQDDTLDVPDLPDATEAHDTDTEDATVETDDPVDPCLIHPRWYWDMDMDGWGRDSETVCAAEQPEGYVDRGGDCCDAWYSVHPEADEWQEEPYTCPDESWDYDCDGEEEPRWECASMDRCDPYCGADCLDITTEEECEATVWWASGLTEACGGANVDGYCTWAGWATPPYCSPMTGGLIQPCR